MQQKCWAHLLRDIDELRVREVGDPAVTTWAAVGASRAEAQQVVTALAAEPAESPWRQAARRQVMAALLGRCQPYLAGDESVPQASLWRRIAKQIDHLFVFVLDPASAGDQQRGRTQPASSRGES